jgi:hypothetical protein
MQPDSRSVISPCRLTVGQSSAHAAWQSVSQWTLYWQRGRLLNYEVGAHSVCCASPLSRPSSEGMTSREHRDTTFHIRNALFAARDFPFLSAKRPRKDETASATTSPESGQRNVCTLLYRSSSGGVGASCGLYPRTQKFIMKMSRLPYSVMSVRNDTDRSINGSSGIL